MATLPVATALIASAPAQAGPPQCDNGPIVAVDCPAGGLCTAVMNDQCVGPIVPPLLPPPGPVTVKLEGTVGI
ncbi:MAG TPA: hypothetical protein VHU62_04605 [Mycobacterium sp.]|nr:hypothetical protein [Mycobacterium sp.]